MSQNYGCFTTLRIDPLADGLGARGWERHVERLRRDTTALFGRPVERAAMVAAVRTAVTAAELPILVRLAVESGDLTISVTTRAVTPSTVPLRVRSVRHDRMRPEMKHTRTAPEFAAKDAAIEAGYDDAVFLTADGLLSEGTTWSLVLGRPDGTWVSPEAPVLPSVTVALVGRAVPITVERVRPEDLGGFDRAAALGSGRGVHTIASIDDWTGTGSVAELARTYTSIPLGPVF